MDLLRYGITGNRLSGDIDRHCLGKSIRSCIIARILGQILGDLRRTIYQDLIR
jgi:hypothetical protein